MATIGPFLFRLFLQAKNTGATDRATAYCVAAPAGCRAAAACR